MRYFVAFKNALLSLCGVGGSEYTRHAMMQDLYYDAEAGIETGRRAGEVHQLGIIRGVPGLAEFVHSNKARLTGRLDMIVESFPHDGLTATLYNARDDSYNALEVPGMVLQNNGVEGTIRDCVVPDRNRGRFIYAGSSSAQTGRMLQDMVDIEILSGIDVIKQAEKASKRVTD